MNSLILTAFLVLNTSLRFRSDLERKSVFFQNIVAGGSYAICLINSASRMTTQLVHLYLVSLVEEEWSQYQKEIENMQLTVANFMASIHNVQQSITDALVHQAESRMHIIKDWYLITGNNTYVQTWSICQCIVVPLSTCIQVVFVRRLFKSTNLTPSFKPRA